jgi:hypothetical protein
MPAVCSLCRQAAESSIKGHNFAACKKCVREKVLPMCLASLGKADLQSAVSELAAQPTEAEKKLAKLTASLPPQLTRTQRPIPAVQFSRGLGTPTRRGRMTPAEQRLAVARAQAKQAGQVFEGDIPALVAKAGLKTNGAAELSTGAAGTRTPTRPAGKSKVPTKADILEMCRRAGLTPVVDYATAT